jgi:polar amino acid transport system permease protein|tara:strand:- start:442 stop:1107 length:666 start_codon:yes stop_codon:yes gene_type:complete
VSNYNWQFETAIEWTPYILGGLKMTVLVAGVSMFMGVLIGLLVAIVRINGKQPWSTVLASYTEFFRTTPILTQLIWVFFALPLLSGFTPSSIASACTALSLNMGAFLGEVFRAGITSVPEGQRDAAQALGMEADQMYRRIVLPQAVRIVIPPVTTYWVSLFKDTSVVSVVAVSEMMFRARYAATQTFLYIEMFTIVGVMYILFTWPQARLSDLLYERLRVK